MDECKHEDAMAAALAATGRYRILRKLDLDGDALADAACDHAASTKEIANDNDDALIAAVVDVETTGIEASSCIIELAIRRFAFHAGGKILGIEPPVCWREDPGAPLDPKIVTLTGLSDADLAGQAIDDATATALMRSADVVLAHNARFDAGFVTRRLPQAAGLAWGCTMRDVDWANRGMAGYGLGWLLAQHGHFHDAHRAGGDVDAVIALLRHRDADGHTALKECLETASRPTWRIKAVGAAYDVKDSLKGRGYRWDPVAAVWSREVPFAERQTEHDWLKACVYASGHRPRAAGPVIEPITWHDRYA